MRDQKQNNWMILAHKVLAICCSLAFAITGILMVAGALVYSYAFLKNILIGLAVIAWGALIWWRERSVWRMVKPDKSFLISDFILLLVIALVGLAFLAGTIFRLLADKCPVFD
jgi:hypothetical protein